MSHLLIFGLVWMAACWIAFHSRSKQYAFASWVCAAVASAIIYPKVYLHSLLLPYGTTVTLLLQIAMFGMGATLTLQDFIRVAKLPWGVMVGLVFQFSIMPLVGWGTARVFGLANELAAGVILLGSCPGGISSNVVTYLARGNVALSVTMTACSTLAAPIMTPLLFYLFAGQTVDVDYVAMFWQIVQTVVAPIGLGLGLNLVVRRFGGDVRSCERWLAGISMVAICLICGLIAAKSQERIMQVGLLLLLAISIHNILGFSLGYWGARLFGLSERDCRTVAIEVGMQNGGMAANLATEILRKDAAALAPVIFAAVMNVNGSILASHWRTREVTVHEVKC